MSQAHKDTWTPRLKSSCLERIWWVWVTVKKRFLDLFSLWSKKIYLWFFFFQSERKNESLQCKFLQTTCMLKFNICYVWQLKIFSGPIFNMLWQPCTFVWGTKTSWLRLGEDRVLGSRLGLGLGLGLGSPQTQPDIFFVATNTAGNCPKVFKNIWHLGTYKCWSIALNCRDQLWGPPHL